MYVEFTLLGDPSKFRVRDYCWNTPSEFCAASGDPVWRYEYTDTPQKRAHPQWPMRMNNARTWSNQVTRPFKFIRLGSVMCSACSVTIKVCKYIFDELQDLSHNSDLPWPVLNGCSSNDMSLPKADKSAITPNGIVSWNAILRVFKPIKFINHLAICKRIEARCFWPNEY